MSYDEQNLESPLVDDIDEKFRELLMNDVRVRMAWDCASQYRELDDIDRLKCVVIALSSAIKKAKGESTPLSPDANTR